MNAIPRGAWVLVLVAVVAVLVPPRRGLAVAADDLPACIRLFEARGYEEAQACFEAYVARQPADAAGLSYLGRTCFERRQPRAAIDWLERALASAPQRSDLHDWLGRAYGIAAQRAALARQFGLAIKARQQFERAVELDPANPDALADLIEFQVQAPAFLGGSLERARLHAAALERLDPLRGRLARAEVLLHTPAGSAAAAGELRDAAAAFPRDPRPWLALAAADEQAGRVERAFDEIETALRLDPDGAEAHHELARAAALSGRPGDLARAEELLLRDLKRLPPGDGAALADCHYDLGAVLERRWDFARAREHYRQALQRDPGLAAARAALRRLP